MVYVYIFTMAIVTYLIRMIPLTLVRKKISNTYIRSFLYYVPYACLTAMTFPAVLYATGNLYSSCIAVVIAMLLAFRQKSLMTVAVFACLAVYVSEQIIRFI